MIKNFKLFELRGPARGRFISYDIDKENNMKRYVVRKYNQRGEIVVEHPVRTISTAYETYMKTSTDDCKVIIVEETKRILSEEEIQQLMSIEKYNL